MAVSQMHASPVAVCDRCGRAARVHVLAGYRLAVPCVSSRCFECADDSSPVGQEPLLAGIGRARLTTCVVGVVITLVALLADVGARDRGVFGWLQIGVCLFGLACFAAGVLVRSLPLAVPGVLLLAIGASSDLLSLGAYAGLGWKQQLVIATGVALMVLNIRMEWQRLWRSRSEA